MRNSRGAMTTTEHSPFKLSWIFLVVLAVFPFLLKTGIDSESVQRQAVLSIYRAWRWSPEIKELRSGSPVIFDRINEKSSFEEFFKLQLQQDFKLTELGDYPHVRVFFVSGSFLQGRVEFKRPGSSNPWRPFEGESRFVNNGILVGAWLGLLIWLFRKSLKISAMVSILAMLLWQVEWNVLDVPGRVLYVIVDFVREMQLRVHYADWTASEMGRLAELGAFLWVALALLVYKFVIKEAQPRLVRNIALLSFAFEPVVFWASSRFGHWGVDAAWWKVYLGSFAFRFVTLGQIFLWVLKPQGFRFKPLLEKRLRRQQLPLWIALIPAVFITSGGWSWLNSVLYSGTGDTLLRLKVFFVGFVLAFVLGSRNFSMWFGFLALAVIFPPSKGHWATAAWYGHMADGLLLGWWVTPFKGILPVLPTGESFVRFGVVTGMAWLFGVFLSSVGVPVGIAWAAVVLAIWAYAQLAFPHGQHPVVA